MYVLHKQKKVVGLKMRHNNPKLREEEKKLKS